MQSVLMVVLVLSGILFVGSVMFMSPKGGLGVGLGGMSGNGEYGSKKSVENTLKKVAVIAAIAFVVSALIYPFISG